MLNIVHIDKVDNDDTAQVAQPKLAGNRRGRLKVGFENGLFKVAVTHIAAGININGGHCLGGVNHQITTGFQLHLATQGFLDLILDTVEIKDGALTWVVLNPLNGIGHKLFGKLDQFDEVFPRVDTHFFNIVAHYVAQSAHKERQIIINDALWRRGDFTLTHLTPQPQQKVHIAF